MAASVYLDRIAGLRQRMADRGLDAVAICTPAARQYFTGVVAADIQPGESAGWLVIGMDEGYGLFSNNHFGEWRHEVKHLTLECLFWTLTGRKYAVRAAEIASQKGWRRIGIEEEALNAMGYREMLEGLKPGQTLELTGKLFEDLRMVKDEQEVALIRKASDITWRAYESVVAKSRPGITESELAWELDKTMHELGAEAPGFDTIVAAGDAAAVPHHVHSDRPIREGESVIVDMGAKFHGYCADMTRTFCFGRAPDRLREIYGTVKVALDEAIRRAQTGNLMTYVGQAGADTGGHGVGLTVHEYPGCNREVTIVPNMTLAIEPGIYIPGFAGVRLEDTVLTRPGEPERLTKASLALEVP